VKLQVTPHITPDDFVRLEVRPEISALAESTVQLTEGLRAPVFTQRFADTTVTVKNGETVVIGGLITTRNEKTTSKVPLIGDVPLVGLLFRADTDRQIKNELLIVLTPRIVRSIQDARRLSIEERDKADIMPERAKESPLFEGLRVVKPTEAKEGEDGAEFGVEQRTPGRKPVLYGPSPILYGPRPPAQDVAKGPAPAGPEAGDAPGEPQSYMQWRR